MPDRDKNALYEAAYAWADNPRLRETTNVWHFACWFAEQDFGTDYPKALRVWQKTQLEKGIVALEDLIVRDQKELASMKEKLARMNKEEF